MEVYGICLFSPLTLCSKDPHVPLSGDEHLNKFGFCHPELGQDVTVGGALEGVSKSLSQSRPSVWVLCTDKPPLHNAFEHFFSHHVQIIQVCHVMSFLFTTCVIVLKIEEYLRSCQAPSLFKVQGCR